MDKSIEAAGPKRVFSFPLRFIDYWRDPLGYLTRTARRYGDIVRLPSPGFPVFMFSHPDQIEEVLRHKHRQFKKDWYMESLKPMLGEGLLTSDGELWRRRRSMAQPAFGAKQIQQYAVTMVAFAERMAASWKRGETRDVHADMMRLTLEIVTKTLFDTEVSDEKGSIGDDLKHVMDYYANPLSMFPWWHRVPTPKNLRFHSRIRRLDSLVFELILQRRESGAADRADLLSRFLVAEDERGQRMSDVELRDELMTMFLAGHETTALVLSYAFYLLGQDPHAAATLADELNRVLGGRSPRADDVPNLCYCEWVIRESMRLYPPAWAIGREAVEDVEIGGCLVPKGAQVLMAQWVVHRDPRFWPDPLRFDPARWGEEGIKNLPRCAYFPFGDGPRTCIGNNFAMMESVLLLATIAQHWRLEPVESATAPSAAGRRAATNGLRLVPSVTMRPRDGIRMIAREQDAIAARHKHPPMTREEHVRA